MHQSGEAPRCLIVLDDDFIPEGASPLQELDCRGKASSRQDSATSTIDGWDALPDCAMMRKYIDTRSFGIFMPDEK